MIGCEPREGGPWHLTDARWRVVSLCGAFVSDRYVKRDPHKIDHRGGERCPTCWMEWRLQYAASLARQDQHLASKDSE